MEKLYEILNEIDSTIQYDKEESLIDDGLLDSLSIISLVAELESAFDVEIGPAELVAENFNSAQRMWNMIEILQKDE